MAFEGPYPQPAEQLIASYNYIDVAEGTGIINYYGIITSEGGRLTTNPLYSTVVQTKGSKITGTSWGKSIDKDFDLDLNLPQNVKGTMLINVCSYSSPANIN